MKNRLKEFLHAHVKCVQKSFLRLFYDRHLSSIECIENRMQFFYDHIFTLYDLKNCNFVPLIFLSIGTDVCTTEHKTVVSIP